MDKIKKYLAEFVGTTVSGVILRLVLAGLALYTGSSTNVGDAVGQAVDKDRSIVACTTLINETPQPVIEKAVESEAK